MQIQINQSEPIDVDEFADYNERLQRYEITHDVELIFPQGFAPFLYSRGNGFVVNPSSHSISLRKGYTWDGPSGPTFATPSLRLSSLVHDVVCTHNGRGYGVDGYWRRHWLYYQIGRANNCPIWRCVLHLVALVIFNWIYSAIKG